MRGMLLLVVLTAEPAAACLTLMVLWFPVYTVVLGSLAHSLCYSMLFATGT